MRTAEAFIVFIVVSFSGNKEVVGEDEQRRIYGCLKLILLSKVWDFETLFIEFKFVKKNVMF